MAVDPVPWFIQAPAEHSAEVARTLAYQAIGGKEGLARRGDLTVQALPVPGGAVQVLPGAAGILNRGSGGAGQAYVGRVGAAVSVPIAATGSGSGRSDLIVFRVDDPQYGGAVPPSAENGPYIMLDVVSGVPAGTVRVQDVPGHEADSAVTLARVDLPASTGTVTGAMITNVSKVANPLTESVLRTYALVTADLVTLTATSAYPAGGQTWPVAVEAAWGEIDIPEWATRAKIVMTWAGVLQPAGDAWGGVWVQVGPTANPDNVKTQLVRWDSPKASNASRTVVIAADDIPIPTALRGTSQKFYPRANVEAGSTNSARPSLDWGSAMVLQVEFYEG